jgi:hypothetical protein
VITNRWLFVGVPLGGVAIALVILGILEWRSRSVVVEAGLWFEDVTFELSHYDVEQLGGALTNDEQQTIRTLARAEVAAAYRDARVRLTESRDALYRVRVVQAPMTAASKVARGAAGETFVFGPFGGFSSVSFTVVVRGAFAYAPSTATRRDIVEAIGRGIGRTVVHELAHQILGAESLHSNDDRSYEYGSPDRIGQYYGPIHWSTAWEPLQRRLGR